MARLSVARPQMKAGEGGPLQKAIAHSEQMGAESRANSAAQAQSQAESQAQMAQQSQAAALQQQAMAPPPALPAQPDEALLNQRMAGMMPSAPRAVQIQGQEAGAAYRARQQLRGGLAQQANVTAAQQAQTVANAAANEDDMLRVGRIISAMSEQKVVPPGHPTY